MQRVTPMEQEIDAFIRFLAVERGLSENYQLSTQRSLGEFAAWCAQRKKISRAREVGLPMISEYLAERKGGGLSASSIKLIVVALKIFFRFATAQGYVTRDPTDALSLPRIERYLPETLNELQVEQLLESVNCNAPLGLRDRAILELLYASGLRISELAGAKLENLNLDEGVVRVTGKGNKTRLVPVGRKACAALARYLEEERPRLVKRRTGSEVFLSNRGGQTNDGAHLADRESGGAAFRARGEHLSAFAPAQFRDPPAEQRRGFAHHPGNAGPRRYLDDAGLHACRPAATESGASQVSSARVKE